MDIKTAITNMVSTADDQHKLWLIYVFVKKLLKL